MIAQAVAIILALAYSAGALQLLEQGWNETRCKNATVAYAFLTRKDLPLWPVWESYFRGCPAGSFKVLVHTQTAGAANAVASVGGEELPPSETMQGDLRFNFSNVDAMLNLFGGVYARGAAPNGCKPRWVHVSSESCAPVQPCTKVHAYLQQYPSESFVDRGNTNPSSNRTIFKSLQWVTLASQHAFALWEDRDEMRARWSDAQKTRGKWGEKWVTVKGVDYNGAVEEFVFPEELKQRGLKMHQYMGLTKVKWQTLPSGRKSGHPLEYATANETEYAINTAHKTNHFFMRKFENTPAVIATLLKNLM